MTARPNAEGNFPEIFHHLKLGGKGREFLLTSSQWELEEDKSMVWLEGTTSVPVRPNSANFMGDYGAVWGTTRLRASE